MHPAIKNILTDFFPAAEEFYPPNRTCTNLHCPHFIDTSQQAPLYDPQRYIAALYTLNNGAYPISTTSLKCRSCNTRYYINYARQQGPNQTWYRLYYQGMPTVLQSEKHLFFEEKLCQVFRSYTVLSHASASATAQFYHNTLANNHIFNTGSYSPPLLRSEYISDLFDLYSLLLHHSEQGTQLALPDSAGSQSERLMAAMLTRNHFMAANGQEQWAHSCQGCRKFFDREGEQYMLSCAVTDGVAIGRPCCAVHNCTNPLSTNRTRYCLPHSTMETLCSVESCQAPVEPGHKTCSSSQHRQLEENYYAAGQSALLLRDRLDRARSYSREGDTPDLGLPSGPRRARKTDNDLKARFGRRSTHNEQLVVRPCGIIIARGTFYGAESLSSVAEFLRGVFPTQKSMPDVLFYDNNCRLHQYLAGRGPIQQHFSKTALVVDVFHFKNHHSTKDVYCTTHCNPMAFPQLYDPETERWTFNSSACEQANAWLNNFHGIVREMLPVRYEFFLDEVIKARNRFLVDELRRNRQGPYLIDRRLLLQ
ncbi:hypothetical protein CALCODRAFT_442621 [Calocera cornea HHB12733]|uniref:CxC5 like cysteine cluster associated with KDZ domain-containing protein n=1 Tax=Calocera cornea HHB12733 TaxID=1353952 RepID=A0A165CZR2_9BASI|nr:hypothetical protein CALCODRAFT_442621 [Calocera cornea HHB12733]